MTDEPYRWLEAIGHRREYVEQQLKGGSPVLAASLPEGVLLLGVGTGQSKVFEIYDRHALGGLGHPADLERVRQQMIDQAHLEGFTRAPHDVALRRLISFGLGPQLKAAFEQIFTPPYLVRLLLAEVGEAPGDDLLGRVEFDGSFQLHRGGWAVVADTPKAGDDAQGWLSGQGEVTDLRQAAALAMRAWHRLTAEEGWSGPPAETVAPVPAGRQVEACLLRRQSRLPARYQPLSAEDLGLPATAPS